MTFTKTNLEGVYILTPRVFQDARGYFFESYNKKEFEQNGLYYDFVQDNQSFSTYGTIRGLHFQKGDHAQAKLVRVISGEVLDVAVDIRRKSPTFGQHVAVRLSGENGKQLLIPRGFAHGFSVLSETAVFAYKCDNFYAKEAEGGLCVNDPALDIDWQIDLSKANVLERDLNHPHLKDLEPCF
ncbi:MAG: dTDP-4-dehydrorhamnose 3,5-epimerase [Alphaproteobacteria bacterium]|nr:dTDP-4-dehydrorhamnose 3,5-epimerase [Alphaproteobacteria bacterium]